MSLAKLYKTRGSRIMGIDASTHTIAFCIFDGEDVVEYGEVTFDGGTVYERILDAKRKISAIRKRFDVDFIALEAAVMVRSAETGLKMAYIFGAILGELLESGASVIEIHPITWQSFIGNTNFTKAQRAAVKSEYPGKSDTWISNKIREMRKRKTMDFFSKKGVVTTSDNVADAAGVAWYAVNNLARV